MTTILSCTCTHAFQDQNYGKGKRLHNKVKQTDKTNRLWRCTICKKEKDK